MEGVISHMKAKVKKKVSHLELVKKAKEKKEEKEKKDTGHE